MDVSMTSNGNGLMSQWKWNSPVPYLFGGLALLFGIIAISLLIVVCSRCHKSHSLFCDCDTNNNSKEFSSTQVVDHEPTNILVIIAGEEHPTHFAKPIYSFTHHVSSS
ncbi:hypothetical protein RIF29_07857 [Crotalaria pallida]|uniref:Uncharacterized protein n=1 Tax=Crotalaria pallida TaxID=3830 RepID=A0AAN9J5Q9_CROPI